MSVTVIINLLPMAPSFIRQPYIVQQEVMILITLTNNIINEIRNKHFN